MHNITAGYDAILTAEISIQLPHADSGALAGVSDSNTSRAFTIGRERRALSIKRHEQPKA
jgi:hypothetical protein